MRIPADSIPGVQKGIRELTAYSRLPLIGLKTVADGSTTGVDSSEMAFQIAASTTPPSNCEGGAVLP